MKVYKNKGNDPVSRPARSKTHQKDQKTNDDNDAAHKCCSVFARQKDTIMGERKGMV
jgi:hypothetical protein